MGAGGLGWMAGFFDGEGCIQIRKSSKGGSVYYNLLVGIDNTDPRPLLIYQERFGGVVKLRERSKDERRKGWRDVWRWNIMAQQAETFLRAVEFLLVNKREEAILALRYRDTLVGHTGPYKDPVRSRQRIEEVRTELSELKHKTWGDWYHSEIAE